MLAVDSLISSLTLGNQSRVAPFNRITLFRVAISGAKLAENRLISLVEMIGEAERLELP